MLKRMDVRLKRLFGILLCLVPLVSACFLERIHVHFTQSGLISFYLCEIFGMLAAVALLFITARRWQSFGKDKKWMLDSALLFALFCFADYGLRFLTHRGELKSLIVLEAALTVVSFLYLIAFELIPLGNVLDALCIFSAALSVASVILFFIARENRITMLLNNHATRTYLLGALFPLTLQRRLKRQSRLFSVLLYLHMGALLFCCIVSAARLNYALIPLLCAVAVVMLIYAKKLSIIGLVAAVVLPCVLALSTAPYNVFVYSSLTRNSVTMSALKVLHIDYKSTEAGSAVPLIPEELTDPNTTVTPGNNKQTAILDAAKVSAVLSSNIRSFAWSSALKDIAKSPLLGAGMRQYSYVDAVTQRTFSVPPHNFILEYTLAFGAVGLFLWVAMAFLPLWFALKKLRFRVWRSCAAACMLASIAFVLAGALLEPYFLSSAVMVFVYFLIGLFSALIARDVDSRAADGVVAAEPEAAPDGACGDGGRREKSAGLGCV